MTHTCEHLSNQTKKTLSDKSETCGYIVERRRKCNDCGFTWWTVEIDREYIRGKGKIAPEYMERIHVAITDAAHKRNQIRKLKMDFSK